ncbi:MAG: Rieske (2Fe-2S) protein [Gemmatimonadota bacterium]
MSENPIDRREAVDVLLRCSAAALTAGLTPLLGCAGNGSGPGGQSFRIDLDRVPAGSGLTTTVRNQLVIVLNVDGAVRAFSGACTHEGCELGWNPRQQLIRCPCHGSAFDPHGQVVKGPAQTPLPEFRTEVRGKKIHVRIG